MPFSNLGLWLQRAIIKNYLVVFDWFVSSLICITVYHIVCQGILGGHIPFALQSYGKL
jgi:hypothetical protein